MNETDPDSGSRLQGEQDGALASARTIDGSRRLRVLWVTNVPLPEASRVLGGVPNPFGGWLSGAALGLASTGASDLHVAFPWKGAARSFPGDIANYHTIPVGRRFSPLSPGQGDHRSRLSEVINSVKPDLMHIWGTELPHCLPAAQAARANGVEFVVSIQGLVGVYGRHLLNTLPPHLQTRYSMMDALRPTSSRRRAWALMKSGEDESRLLSLARQVIGRTTWDRACVRLQNPTATYYHCDEVLRPSFWGADLTRESRVQFSIFMAQGNQELKGLHIALDALSLLRRSIPARLVVAGADPSLLKNPYGRFIRSKIRSLALGDAVTFTGLLDETQVLSHLRSSSAYILPSIIDNSPNSLCEAMILGIPCVASYVGGVPDLLAHGVEGFLYPADAPYMLAHYLQEVLTNEQLSLDLGRRGTRRASLRHDPDACSERLLNIYRSVMLNSREAGTESCRLMGTSKRE